METIILGGVEHAPITDPCFNGGASIAWNASADCTPGAIRVHRPEAERASARAGCSRCSSRRSATSFRLCRRGRHKPAGRPKLGKSWMVL